MARMFELTSHDKKVWVSGDTICVVERRDSGKHRALIRFNFATGDNNSQHTMLVEESPEIVAAYVNDKVADWTHKDPTGQS